MLKINLAKHLKEKIKKEEGRLADGLLTNS